MIRMNLIQEVASDTHQRATRHWIYLLLVLNVLLLLRAGDIFGLS